MRVKKLKERIKVEKKPNRNQIIMVRAKELETRLSRALKKSRFCHFKFLGQKIIRSYIIDSLFLSNSILKLHRIPKILYLTLIRRYAPPSPNLGEGYCDSIPYNIKFPKVLTKIPQSYLPHHTNNLYLRCRLIRCSALWDIIPSNGVFS